MVKIPLTREGIAAAPSIRALGSPILMTAAYDAKQMFVANALHAEYIAPYFGRIPDNDIPPYDVLRQMHAINATAGYRTRILVAALRSAGQMVDLAEQGHDCFTVSPAIAEALLEDPMTLAAVNEFERVTRDA